MKTILTLLLAAFALVAVAQPPKINYQAIALGSNGKPLKNATVSLRLSVLDSSANGTVLYTETQPATTDAGGQFSVYLGTGTPTAGTFASLPWANRNDKFLKVEMDAQVGNNYQAMGTTQLVSVPYAMAAGSVQEGVVLQSKYGKSYQLNIDSSGPKWTCYPPVSKSNAGPDQLLVSGISVVLHGSIPNPSLNPSFKESGKWTIISGGLGQIVSNSQFNSTFLGKMDSSYLLTWTIQNYCGSSTDTVAISFQGNGWVFNNGCPGGSQVNYSGQIYPTIQIGSQCWFQKNLNIGTQVFQIEQTNNAQIEKYCYDNDPLQCDTFGGLYQWAEAVNYQGGMNNDFIAPAYSGDVQGICPTGWHVPSYSNWCRLVTYLDNTSNCLGNTWSTLAGGALKTTNLWNPPNVGATNVSKFSALPGGFYGIDSTFGLKYQVASFWSSQDLGSFGGNINFYSGLPETGTYPYKKKFGFSIRCINDTSFSTTAATAGPDQLTLTGSTATLAANTPAAGETGTWTINTGSGATLSNANSPTATFAKGADSSYSLVWTIYGPCGASSDTVHLLFPAPVHTVCGQAVFYAGESYPTVQIGTQCWFSKNLNVGTMIQGANEQTNNSTLEKYCYNNDSANCMTYGGLYQWAEAVQYQNGASNSAFLSSPFSGNVRGICPTGWHLPSDAEWSTLETFLGGSSFAGGALKSTSGLWTSPNSGATNSSGFSGLPGGYRISFGAFYDIGNLTNFWSSSESSSTSAINRLLDYSYSDIYRVNYSKSSGFSARCAQD